MTITSRVLSLANRKRQVPISWNKCLDLAILVISQHRVDRSLLGFNRVAIHHVVARKRRLRSGRSRMEKRQCLTMFAHDRLQSAQESHPPAVPEYSRARPTKEQYRTPDYRNPCGVPEKLPRRSRRFPLFRGHEPIRFHGLFNQVRHVDAVSKIGQEIDVVWGGRSDIQHAQTRFRLSDELKFSSTRLSAVEPAGHRPCHGHLVLFQRHVETMHSS